MAFGGRKNYVTITSETIDFVDLVGFSGLVWLAGSGAGGCLARVRPRAASVFHGWGGCLARVRVADWLGYGLERLQFFRVGVAVCLGRGWLIG